jgi:hypothetical protein
MAASSKPKRGRGRPFQKGQSGNPTGLSAQRRRILADLQRDEEQHVRLAVARLRDMALSSTVPIADVRWAMEQYLDRMGIQMPESLEVTGEDGAPLKGEHDLLTTDELRKRLEQVMADRRRLLEAKGDGAKS